MNSELLEAACNGRNLDTFFDQIRHKELKITGEDYQNRGVFNAVRISISNSKDISFMATNRIQILHPGIIVRFSSNDLNQRIDYNINMDSKLLEIKGISEDCRYVCDLKTIAKYIKTKVIEIL